MGADVRLERDGLTVTHEGDIYGVDLDLHDAGEIAPTVAGLAALAVSPSRLRGIGHLRGHETDRLEALATEVRGLGGEVDVLEDGLRITPRPLHGGRLAQLRRPPDGDDRRRHRPARARGARRGRRDHRQDAAGLRRHVGRAMVAAAGPADPRRARADVVRRRSTASWDESDARARPPRRGTRPRTKDRPAHDDAVPGWVTTIDRGRYTCLVPAPAHGEPADPDAVVVTAVRAREIRPSGVAVGDVVGLVGDTSGTTDSLSRLVRVEPRSSALRRSADDTDPVERVVVANADQVCLVVAAADPEPNPRLVDRALVAAWDAGIDPLLVVTKTDLADPAGLLAAYADLGLRRCR